MHAILKIKCLPTFAFFSSLYSLSLWWHKYFAKRQTDFCLSYYQRPPFQSARLFFLSTKFDRFENCDTVTAVSARAPTWFEWCRRYSYRFCICNNSKAKQWAFPFFVNANTVYDISLAERWTRWDLQSHKLWAATKNGIDLTNMLQPNLYSTKSVNLMLCHSFALRIHIPPPPPFIVDRGRPVAFVTISVTFGFACTSHLSVIYGTHK